MKLIKQHPMGTSISWNNVSVTLNKQKLDIRTEEGHFILSCTKTDVQIMKTSSMEKDVFLWSLRED